MVPARDGPGVDVLGQRGGILRRLRERGVGRGLARVDPCCRTVARRELVIGHHAEFGATPRRNEVAAGVASRITTAPPTIRSLPMAARLHAPPPGRHARVAVTASPIPGRRNVSGRVANASQSSSRRRASLS